MTIKLLKKVRRIFLATTATTNLMSLNTQPPKSVSSSLRQTSTRRQPQYNNSSDNSFDRVLDRYSNNQSTRNDDVTDMSSENVHQETTDPVVAVVSSTSAQGKSKDTQDAPQKESQSVEETIEVQEIEETDNPADLNKITVMNLFVPFSVDSQNINPTDVNIQENDSPNLMSILPQSQESNDKSQDMLNLLAGRTWKINSQNQSVNQVEDQTVPTFTDELSLQIADQQTQVQNNLSIGNNTNSILQDLSVQQNMIENYPQTTLNDVNIGLSETAAEVVNNLDDLIPSTELLSNLEQPENLTQATSNANTILNDITNVRSDLPVQNLNNNNSSIAQSEQQNISLTDSDIIDDVVQQPLNREQLPTQGNTISRQPISAEQEQTNITQSLQQPQAQLTTQTSAQTNSNVSNSAQQTAEASVNGQPSLVSNIQVQSPLEQPPVHQSQPQQVTYQVQQVQPSTQAEIIEMPQVQTIIAESQPEVANRQQLISPNLADLTNSEGEFDRSQMVNPSQQTLQQQSQNQQQQNFQSQMQQTTSTGAEVESSASSAEQQAPTENFATHLGAAVNNNTNNEPINVSSEPLEQTDQTARQENITTQIVEHARMIRNAENTEMVIQLKPEHLGELTLRVSAATNGSVNVTFHSENAQVRAMIENTLVQLKQELSNQGLKVENVQVSAHLSDGGMMNGRGQQAWEQNQRSNNNSRIGRIGRAEGGGLTAAEEAEIISTTVNENIVTADSVDYRV